MSIEHLLKNVISNGLPKGLLLQVRDEHHVHLLLGLHWKYSDRNAALGTGADMSYLIRTGINKIEFTFVVFGSAESDVQFFESPITTADGTPQIAYNHHREAAVIPTILIFKTPTVSATGTSLLYVDAGTGTSPGHAGAGGVSVEQDSWILRPNTDYLVRFTNSSNGNIVANVQIDWFEKLSER